MSKLAQRSVKYCTYIAVALIGMTLALFGINAKESAGRTVSGDNLPGILGETAHADHAYSQASYYSQSYYQNSYYSQSAYYSQSYYQSWYGWGGDDGDDDDGDDDGI